MAANRGGAITMCDGHPVINVKYYGELGVGLDAHIAAAAYINTVDAFWEEAQHLAHERGYSGVFPEGRSDGWLAPYYQTAPGASKPSQFAARFWPGQGPTLGYSTYPDVANCGAERERFRAFQRRIAALMARVPEMYQHHVDALLEELAST